MKSTLISLLLVLPSALLLAQAEQFCARVELRGAASFSSAQVTGNSGLYYKTHTVECTPSCGYFATSKIEVLFDLQYAYSSTENGLSGEPGTVTREHQLGFAAGLAYNYPVSPLFTPFVGTKVGLSWDRLMFDGGYDSGWGRRRISFPDVVLGCRVFVSREWALLVFAEYTKTAPLLHWDRDETIKLGFGFSVFI
jgi:hypothetical protein